MVKSASKQKKSSASKQDKSASTQKKSTSKREKSTSKPKSTKASKSNSTKTSEPKPTSKQNESTSKQQNKSDNKKVKSSNKQEWKYSQAKKLLVAGLSNGDIPLDANEMPAEVVYQQQPDFTDFTFTHFKDRLRYNRSTIAAKKKRANEEMQAFLHDQALYPRQPTNQFGEPRWEGSEAEQFLRLDMDQGIHLTMKPMQLFYSRPEYHEVFTLDVFRKHIDQERHGRRFNDFLITKRKQKDVKHEKKLAKYKANK